MTGQFGSPVVRSAEREHKRDIVDATNPDHSTEGKTVSAATPRDYPAKSENARVSYRLTVRLKLLIIISQCLMWSAFIRNVNNP